MSQRLKADLGLALASFFWGATFVVVKDAVSRSSVFLFLTLRFGLAAVLMTALQRRTLRGLRAPELLAGLQLGVFMFGGYVFQTFGLKFTTPAKSAFVTGSSVVLVPLLMALFWRRHLRAWVYVGVLAAVAGLYFVTVPGGQLARLNRGDVLTLLAATLYAVHIILVGQYTHKHPLGALSFLQVAATALFALVVTLVSAATRWEPLRFVASWQLYAAVGITSIFPTAAAFTIQVWAQKYTTASHAAILFTLEPVFAAATSFLVIGERLGARALAGAGLVMAGVFLAEWKGPARAAAESPGPVTQSP
jgi:drug/metabolite transporter (DMT)-like permease